jgi:hypothetical protein
LAPFTGAAAAGFAASAGAADCAGEAGEAVSDFPHPASRNTPTNTTHKLRRQSIRTIAPSTLINATSTTLDLSARW